MSKKFLLSKAEFRANSHADPWKSLVPERVAILIFAPELIANCASVMCDWTLNSCSASGGGLIAQILVKSLIIQQPIHGEVILLAPLAVHRWANSACALGVHRETSLLCVLYWAQLQGVRRVNCVNSRPFNGRSTVACCPTTSPRVAEVVLSGGGAPVTFDGLRSRRKPSVGN